MCGCSQKEADSHTKLIFRSKCPQEIWLRRLVAQALPQISRRTLCEAASGVRYKLLGSAFRNGVAEVSRTRRFLRFSSPSFLRRFETWYFAARSVIFNWRAQSPCL